MNKVFFFFAMMFFLFACNNSADNTTTADSLNRASGVDTTGRMDTTSYERNNVTGADSSR